MLVRTEYFPEEIKHRNNQFISYIIDYADYSGTILEQIGEFRYREIDSCVLGQSNAKELKALIANKFGKKIFFCNNRMFYFSKKMYMDVIERPEQYAAVLFKCYQ